MACGGVTVEPDDAGPPLFSGGLGGASGSVFPSAEGDAGSGSAVDASVQSRPDAGQPGFVDAGAGFVNPRFQLPDAGDAGAMTCAWLDSNNCWKQQVDALVGCGLPVGAVGPITADGRGCVFDGGVSLAFSGAVPEPTDGGNTLWIASFRLSTPRSPACFETAYAFAQSRFSAGTSQVDSHNRSLLTYEIMCPDRSVFDNVSENGACSDFGLRYLLGRVPGHDISCDATECRVQFNGATEGRRIAARCLR